MCKECGRNFSSSRKPAKSQNALWKSYVFDRDVLRVLAARSGRSVPWLRKKLRSYELPQSTHTPRPMVAIMDCVFFGHTHGWLVVRDPLLKENVYVSGVESETLAEYQCARDTLESLGYTLLAVVADGKPGLAQLFEGLPVQMCHFHMKTIITKYLTRSPKLEAGKELRALMHTLCHATETEFSESLDAWHDKWGEFIKERTVDPVTGRWHYTHKRLRSARRSLKHHLPYLFTYRNYPKLGIPNTTNSLDGSFSHLKELVRIHRGISPLLRDKIIRYILLNQTH